jgi:hypothetical protein
MTSYIGPPLSRNSTFRQTCTPNITQALYARICNDIMRSSTLPSEVFNLQLLPLAVIAAQCVLPGNEAATGLDILRSPTQRADVLKAIDKSGSFVMSGPIELVQGGFDMIGLVAVFVPTAAAAVAPTPPQCQCGADRQPPAAAGARCSLAGLDDGAAAAAAAAAPPGTEWWAPVLPVANR